MLIKSKLTGTRLVSLPFSDYCEPLFSSINEVEMLKDYLFRFGNNNNISYIEFRTTKTRYPYETDIFRTDLRHTLILNKTEDELFKSFSTNTRRNIKSAIKQGITIKSDNTKKGLELFYKLQCITRKKHGIPPQPFSFFKNIYKFILSHNKGEILFAYNRDIPVAALMFFLIGKKVLYKYGASLSNRLPKGANHLVMWEAIKKYMGTGYEEFYLGRTEKHHEGLRSYKLGFGTDESEIYTTRFKPETNNFIPLGKKTTGIHNKIFQRLPVAVLKIIGNTLYRHIG